MPELCRPNVKAANEIEGLLKVNRTRIKTGGGIKRNKNDIDPIKILPILLLKINMQKGGKLIATAVDKRLKTIVSNISFKKSEEMNSD